MSQATAYEPISLVHILTGYSHASVAREVAAETSHGAA